MQSLFGEECDCGPREVNIKEATEKSLRETVREGYNGQDFCFEDDLELLSGFLEGAQIALVVRCEPEWQLVFLSNSEGESHREILDQMCQAPSLLDYLCSGGDQTHSLEAFVSQSLRSDLEELHWYAYSLHNGGVEEPGLLVTIRNTKPFSTEETSLIKRFGRLVVMEVLQRPPQSQVSTHLLKGSLVELANLNRAIDASTIMAITDPSGVIRKVNRKFCEVSGYTEEELLGKTHRVINSGAHGNEFWISFWHTIREGRIWRGVIQNRKKSGDYYWVNTTIIPFKNSSGKISQYIALRSEVTDLVEARQALQREQEELKQTYEDLKTAHLNLEKSERLAGIGQLASGIAHDFNNSLSVILMGLELCMEDLENHEFLHKTLFRVRNTAVDSVSLTRRLLTLGAKQPSQLGPVHLESIILGAVDLLRPRFQSLGVDLEISIRQGLVEFLADGPALEDALRNLVLNSLHAIEEVNSSEEIYRPKGSYVRLSGRIIGEEVCISVEDNGPGIPEEIKERIFEPFFTTKGREGSVRGTGLGLSMVQSIIHRHGGVIEMKSEISPGSQNRGTSFLINVPCKSCQESKKSRVFDLECVATDQWIWVLDDEKYFLQLIRTALSKFGYSNIRCFWRANDFLNALEEESPPGIVICDLEMPQPDGFEVHRVIQQMSPSERPAFLAMTGKPERRSMERLGLDSEESLLVKPLRLSRLREMVVKLLAEAKES